MKWEPYNKDPSLLCGVPESGDPQKGYRIVSVHDHDGDPRECWAGVDNLEHEAFVRRIAAGLNLLDKLEHLVGNPVFVIETNLEPLRKRIKEAKDGAQFASGVQETAGRANRMSEALEIVDEIQASVEKIKTAIKGDR